MTYYNQNEYLSHHGIKGQKWGVRRYQDYDGKRFNSGKVTNSQKIRDTKRERINANNNRSQLSDEELQNRINRLRKEQELDRLTTEQYKRGQTYVEGLLKNQGTQIVTAVVTATVTPLIIGWLKGNK